MRSAFTLLELLLVLALMAAVAALTWPVLERPLATQRLRRAAEQVRTQLIKARTKAISTGETFGFRYQPGKPLMRIGPTTENQALIEASSMLGATGSQMGGGMPMGGATQMARPSSYGGSTNGPNAQQQQQPVEEALPEPIVFYGGEVASDARAEHVAAQERMTGSVNLDWSQPLLFHPDGTALAARIALVGDRGRAIVVEVRSLTGAVRIGEVVSVEALRQ